MMKRASLQRRSAIAALIAALLWSLAPGAALSDHTPSGDNEAAKVTLASTAEVKITAGPGGVLIEWRTSFELDNLGFNVYREQGGARTQVNPAIIAGSALIAGQGTPLYAGYTYQWLDAAGSLDSRYYLEDVDLSGAKTVLGPFAPVWNETLPKSQQAKTASEVAAAQASENTQEGGPAGVFDKPELAPAAIQDQWAIAAQAGLKIGVKQNGWYRVTLAEMLAAGFVPIEAANLRMFVDGREIPIEVSKSSGPLSANDFLEFYGTGLDTLTTDTHVYYLLNGSQSGLRVPVFGEMKPDVIPASSPPPLPVAKPAAEPQSSVDRGWFGAVSWGVAVERVGERVGERVAERVAATVKEQDETKPPPAVVDQSNVGSIPPVERTTTAGPVRHVSDASDLKPAANTVKEVPPEVAALKVESKANSAPRRTMSSAARQVPPAKSRRRRGQSRRRRGSSRPKHNHAQAAPAATAGFLYEVQLKERRVYFSSLLNGAAENFFGGSLLTPPTTKTLKVTNLQTDSQGTALLRIGLQGTSNGAHMVNVLVNDVMVGSVNFVSRQYAEGSFNVAVSQLYEGDNVIKFVIAGGSGDQSLFSYARLTYPRTFRADNDTLSFALRSTQSAKVEGFATPNVRVLDISDPNAVQTVDPVVENTGPGFAVSIQSAGAKAKGSRTLLALPANSFRQAASLVSNQASTLNLAANPANAADLLIISHKNFIPSLGSLVTKRQSEGLTVKVVDVEDVFDEFSYGLHTPQAITDFLSLARATWIKAPRYLLLVGDASYDYRNYEGAGNFDLVPTRLIDTFFTETGSDDTLADFNGDGIPEIPVGRLPVRTVAEANLVISKIVNFLPANVPQSAVMVADTQGSYFFNFEQANEQLIPLMTANMQANVQRVYRAQQPSDAAARANIISKINSGAALVNYSGHGNVNVWTGAPIFNTADAMALTNGNKLPLVIVMDCLNGYFIAPPIDCISEAMMKAPNGGAVASFSSSGLTIPIGQHDMGEELFNLLYNGPPIALGDATRQAKAATTDLDVRRTWILFGDPSMKIR
jgi:hypothetical protein